MSTDEKPVCSEARLLANRKNALLSTGPKTAEGKKRSSQNAMTHGFCAVKFEVVGDDVELLQKRHDAWQAELNPDGLELDGYLVARLVRTSARLDRLDTSYEARTSKATRDAYKDDHERKLREIDGLKTMLVGPDCDIAVRRLMTTTEGCEYLIHEWTCLRPAMQPVLERGAHWDHNDLTRLNQLTSNDTIIKRIASSIYVLPTIAIKEYREVAVRLKLNEEPHRIAYQLRYETNALKIRDEQNAPELYAKAETARLFLLKTLEDHLALLTDLKLKLEAEDAKQPDEVSFRAIFDASPEGKLMHRYELDAERSFYRGLKELRDAGKARIKSPQTDAQQEVTQQSIAKPAPPAARNEPDKAGRNALFSGRIASEIANLTFIDIPMIPPKRLRDQQ